MSAQRSLQVVEQSLEELENAETSADGTVDVPDVEPDPLYERAREFRRDDLPDGARRAGEFLDVIVDEVEIDADLEEARVLDELHVSDDVDFAFLLVWPSEDLLLLGSDPTAKDALPYFAFAVSPYDPIPAPTDVDDALALLKPTDVERVMHEDDYLPDRQGEWWLLPTPLVPTTDVFRPGVSKRPYGPSPLGNHVPREYAFTVSEAEFLESFRERVPRAPRTIASIEEAMDWLQRQHRKRPTPEYVPGWDEVRELAGDVLVRGTIRHRDDDHFVEDVGDVWHRAETHNMDVWTADAVGLRPRID